MASKKNCPIYSPDGNIVSMSHSQILKDAKKSITFYQDLKNNPLSKKDTGMRALANEQIAIWKSYQKQVLACRKK